MTALFARFTGLASDRKGVTALEYGLIAAAVVAVGLASFSIIGTELATKMNTVQTALDE